MVTYKLYSITFPFFLSGLTEIPSVLSNGEGPADGTGSDDSQPTICEVSAAVDRAQCLPQTQPGTTTMLFLLPLCCLPCRTPHEKASSRPPREAKRNCCKREVILG